ncbi:MAG: alpha/beta hydrolase [Chloroflexota bacterium]|nr:alpha/beta hydrolase [Chloroflexota bacterium]
MNEEVVNINGTKVSITGHGRPVVLIHGVFMDRRMWTPQIECLSQCYLVCCMDMLGHGDAPDPDGERTLKDFVEQLCDVITYFTEYKPVLGGFSMGGLVAQAYAVHHHLNLSGLILMNTVYDRSDVEVEVVKQRYADMSSRGIESIVESASQRWFTDLDRETVPDKIEEILGWMRSGPFAAKHKAYPVFAYGDKEVAGKLGQISCPALIMTGSDDLGSTPLMAEKMASSIPDATLRIVSGQRHMMPVLESNLVNELILEFLKT